ncbi:MAG TPA: PAS domain S-box protein [Oculatellaceae cyanobacterium]
MTDLSKGNPTNLAEPQYGKNEEFYDFLLNGLSDLAIYMIGPTGLIQTWNRGAKTIKQYDANEVIGKNFSMFYTKSDLDKNLPAAELQQASRTGRFEGSGWRQRKDGSLVWVEVVISPLKDQNGELKGFVKVTRDATEKKKSEEIIERQKKDLIELSTPVMNLWQGILALPIVGTLDSTRSQIVTERLLQGLASSGCNVAILDISGVPTVDTVVAQHLMKTVGAARLMGAECIISGIRPEIAQTMVHLGIDLSAVKTKSSMSRALVEAMTMVNLRVVYDGQKVLN